MWPQLEEQARSTVGCILAFILRRKILQQVTTGNRIECFLSRNAQGTPQLDLKILFLIKNADVSRKDVLSGTCRPSTSLAFSFLEHKRIAYNVVLATERTFSSPITGINFPFFLAHPKGLPLHTARLSQLRDRQCCKGTFQPAAFFLLEILCPMQWLRAQALEPEHLSSNPGSTNYQPLNLWSVYANSLCPICL